MERAEELEKYSMSSRPRANKNTHLTTSAFIASAGVPAFEEIHLRERQVRHEGQESERVCLPACASIRPCQRSQDALEAVRRNETYVAHLECSYRNDCIQHTNYGTPRLEREVQNQIQ